MELAGPSGYADDTEVAVIPLAGDEDTDSDGMPDWWEMKWFGTLAYGPNDDPDGDGLTNLQEYQYGTNPNNEDTDGDGLTDGWEVAHGLNPTDAADGNQLRPLMLEQSRSRIIECWKRIYPTPLVFTNTPGSPADLTDIKNALLGLSGVFNKAE